jgi:Fuc2NAc and GlcNAc transferase
LRRLSRKENIFKAHCSHAYQHAARRYQSHTVVTLVILGVNCVWLLPIAVLVQQRVFSELMGISIAFAPLILLVLKFGTER